MSKPTVSSGTVLLALNANPVGLFAAKTCQAGVLSPAEAKLRLPEPSVYKNVMLVIDCGNVIGYDCPA